VTGRKNSQTAFLVIFRNISTPRLVTHLDRLSIIPMSRREGHYLRNRHLRFALCGVVALAGIARSENKFTHHNLVSDIEGLADFHDPDLTNPWGIALSPTSPFWIVNNRSGTAKIYDGTGKAGELIVSIPGIDNAGLGSGTGQVFNPTGQFLAAPDKPATFIFSTEDGIISGWYRGIEGNRAVELVNRSGLGAIYKGLAISTSEAGALLYAADFHNGRVDVFAGDFSTPAAPDAFVDPDLPAGFAPFNIYVCGGKVFVTYAKQDTDAHDDMPGAGNGYIDVFDLKGTFMQRLVSGEQLNSPWGMAIAPAGFGDFGNALLVGNFGDGVINAYDPATGDFLGALNDVDGKPIVNLGLWALQFGNGAAGGDKNTLYFTAGIPGPEGQEIESHGLFGTIQAAPVIKADGIVDSAASKPQIAPNGWVSIYGTNLAPTTRSWQDSDFIEDKLPRELSGVSVTINGVNAYPSYISPTKVNILAPAGTAPGPAEIQVKNGDLVSAKVNAEFQPVAPAFFMDGDHVMATRPDGSKVNSSAPAQPGELLTLYGNGFGETNPAFPDGMVLHTTYPLAASPTIYVGASQALVMSAELVAAGMYQFNIRIPEDVITGESSVIAEAGGVRSPDGALLTTMAHEQPQPPPNFDADIDNFQFRPPSITLTAGGQLTWTNRDSAAHTVVSDDAKFGSKVLEQNATFAVQLTEPGTYSYHCSIHPFMKGKIVVQK
jgi:uncharacterized protein (TIGR03118 family)